MPKRQPPSEIEAPGQDSFLDVVANLVGILIILVMVVGAAAKKGAMDRAAQQTAAITGPPAADVSAAETAATAVEKSILELQEKLSRQDLEIAYREAERNKYQLLVTVAEQRLAEHRGQLSSADQAKYDLQVKLAASQNELAKLSQAQTAAVRPVPTALQHLPTPMAKTVFGSEVHFRLLGGRLTYVPWDEMLGRLKADAPNHVQKLRDAPRVELGLPVIDGFGARYILRRANIEVQTRLGAASQSHVELEKLYFVDAEPNLGVPLAEALSGGSEFRARLAGRPPQRTTVTVWVYPDSFDEFRTLKAELFKLGFLTAGRPLPMNHPIGGSPDGTRSSAE
ncbi:MAG: hypothetical protein SFU86_09270 [Pirellulaceae bacterium]|nr:hypothetical protein [Pirellulaceae bacterium]